jgi:hypothetical protein
MADGLKARSRERAYLVNAPDGPFEKPILGGWREPPLRPVSGSWLCASEGGGSACSPTPPCARSDDSTCPGPPPTREAEQLTPEARTRATGAPLPKPYASRSHPIPGPRLDDQDVEVPHEHVQATWPPEDDFDAEVERFLNETLDDHLFAPARPELIGLRPGKAPAWRVPKRARVPGAPLAG